MGFRSTSTGVLSDSSFSRCRSIFTPRRPAIAVRWISALVDPPSASSTRSAFSTDCSVMISDGRIGWVISFTASAPASSAARSRSACTAGMEPWPSGTMPSASAMQAMVEAVPITPQVPAVVARRPSIWPMRSAVTRPAR